MAGARFLTVRVGGWRQAGWGEKDQYGDELALETPVLVHFSLMEEVQVVAYRNTYRYVYK
jgi:hypothetical protein